jgi:hypothetical protein
MCQIVTKIIGRDEMTSKKTKQKQLLAHDDGHVHGRRVGPNVSVCGARACWFGLKLSVALELQDSHVDFKIAIVWAADAFEKNRTPAKVLPSVHPPKQHHVMAAIRHAVVRSVSEHVGHSLAAAHGSRCSDQPSLLRSTQPPQVCSVAVALSPDCWALTAC